MTDEHVPSTDLNAATGEENREAVVTSKGSELKKKEFLMIFYIKLFR